MTDKWEDREETEAGQPDEVHSLWARSVLLPKSRAVVNEETQAAGVMEVSREIIF